jgi:translation initiation factor 3 subunit L
LKPGAAAGLRAGVPQQLQRNMDKVLALIAILFVLHPSNRLDEQVKELVEGKWSDKLRRLQAGDKACFSDMFEHASPKFISPAVPDYSTPLNSNQDAFAHQVSVFNAEVQQQVAFLKLRSFLGLYAAIDISKLARFNDVSEADLICQLASFKHKSIQHRAPSSSGATGSRGNVGTRVNVTDVHYFVEDGVLTIDGASQKADANRAHERYFAAGVRKHAEIIAQLNKLK